MRLGAEIESGRSRDGWFGGVLFVAVSYLSRDVYLEFPAIYPSASWPIFHQIQFQLRQSG